MTPFSSVAMLEKFALLKMAFCKAPVLSRASSRWTSAIAGSGFGAGKQPVASPADSAGSVVPSPFVIGLYPRHAGGHHVRAARSNSARLGKPAATAELHADPARIVSDPVGRPLHRHQIAAVDPRLLLLHSEGAI